MVAHSIIIPHRDRQHTLEVCLFSIARSAAICETNDYEVVVVDNGSQTLEHIERWGKQYPHVRWLNNWSSMRQFNKPVLQNAGIDMSFGEVLTFIDADAIVGPLFMDNPYRLRYGPTITKICYRVRLIPTENIPLWQQAENKGQVVKEWFFDYNKHTLAFEAYGRAEQRYAPGAERVGVLFGNSHFSIRRDVLGDIRFDEELSGHGVEDVITNWWLQQKFGDDYNPLLVSDAAHAVICLQHQYNDPRWLDGKSGPRNLALYEDTVAGRRKYGRLNKE